MTDMTVANTIFAQIKALDPRALMAWGVIGHPTNRIVGGENYLSFKSAGMVRWKGYVKITLNSLDLYDIEFSRFRAGKQTIDKVVNDVYCDQLVEIIDAQVG